LQDHEFNAAAGRQALERELTRLGLQDLSYDKLAHKLDFQRVEDLLSAIGRNDIKISLIIKTAEELSGRKRMDHLPVEIQPRPGTASTTGEINIMGVGDLLTHLAGCCKPVPGDEIGGYITKGRGVSIHRRECPNMLRYSNECPERLIAVDWGRTTSQPYQVDVQITAFDRPGLLRDITSVLANEKLNVTAINTLSGKTAHLTTIRLTIEITSIDQLSQVLAKISQVSNVVGVCRSQH
ncbi:MAG TPA: ACT domain-containing protein, partial [Gammaproteobacteria bacterium]|nr:ACT domain-containing protein [Gammaproteobacteria bacterium]